MFRHSSLGRYLAKRPGPMATELLSNQATYSGPAGKLGTCTPGWPGASLVGKSAGRLPAWWFSYHLLFICNSPCTTLSCVTSSINQYDLTSRTAAQEV